MLRSYRKLCSSIGTGGKWAQRRIHTSAEISPQSKQLQYAEDFIEVESSSPIPTTSKLDIVDTKCNPTWPAFRLIDLQGRLVPGVPEIEVEKEQAQKMYRTMGRLQSLDDVLYNAQRQGRISFYMQSSGEEATHVGSASALDPSDMIFAQYRETGVLLWRGFTVQQAADQCFSNEADLGRGRQMPIHYGSKQLNFQTISSPLTTQLPQAVGAAYAFKISKNPSVTVCYFGEGAASEGDFHAALNFAATLEVPMIFFCRNNGYAISTSTADQYRSDGIVARAAAYGMHGVRVDGNDIFAVREATAAARKLALEESRPVLIEAMTYRRGHHSTSDDSTRYRSLAEIKHWQQTSDPMARLRLFMEERNWWDAEQEQSMRDSERHAVLIALETAEKRAKPPLREMFDDVYSEKPPHILKQEKELMQHIRKYPSHYFSGDGGGH